MIKNIINYLSIYKRKYKYKKNSYSFNGVDLILDYVFKNKKIGFYLDIGAQHPIANNNTYLLFKRGWSGINIDLDKKNIDLFKIARPKDYNINCALSDKIEETDLFFYHDGSPINTLNKDISNYQSAKIKEVKKIKTNTLNNILKNLKIENQIDYFNLDVEGHEEKVLSGFDIDIFKPLVVSVEFLDLKMRKLEYKNNDIQNVLNSNIYKYFINKNYYFVNWLHGDLIFVHKDLRD